MEKQNIRDMSLAEIEALITSLGKEDTAPGRS